MSFCIFDYEFIDAVGVFAVREVGGHLHLLLFVGEVDEGHALVAAHDGDDGAVIAGGDGLGQACHGRAEPVGGDDLGMLELGIAAGADAVVTPVVVAGAVVGTAEEEGVRASGAGG